MNRLLRGLLDLVGVKARQQPKADTDLPVLSVGPKRTRPPTLGRPGTGGFRRQCIRAILRGRTVLH